MREIIYQKKAFIKDDSENNNEDENNTENNDGLVGGRPDDR
jgi:hypothetical protein